MQVDAPEPRDRPLHELHALARRALDAARAGKFPLADTDRRALTDFILLMARRRIVLPELGQQVVAILRQYEQHLIALGFH